jgi:[ribosomal protein S18]-alanine N-acetyltransferase
MTLRDVEAVHQIEEATFAMPWSLNSFTDEMERNACARYLVAEENGEIVGYAGAWIIFEEGHVTNVAVEASRRGQGIGKALMAALMQYAANLGVKYLTLEVRKSNLAARKLYERFGFIQLSVRKRYYEDNGEDALLLVCDKMPPVEENFTEANE